MQLINWYVICLQNVCPDVQTIEKDLRMMKPQIDAIVTKCEALKTESASEQYNRLLNDNGIYSSLCIYYSSLCIYYSSLVLERC